MKSMMKALSIVLALCLMLSMAGWALVEDAGAVKLTVWCWSPNNTLLETGAQMYNARDLAMSSWK